MTEFSPQSSTAFSIENSEADRGAWATIGFMLLGALAMTSCCILPLALVSLGVTGVFIGELGSLYQYHWYFLAFAVGAIAYGIWKSYRPIVTENCTDGTCERPINRTIMRSVMWLSLAIVIGSQVFSMPLQHSLALFERISCEIFIYCNGYVCGIVSWPGAGW